MTRHVSVGASVTQFVRGCRVWKTIQIGGLSGANLYGVIEKDRTRLKRYGVCGSTLNAMLAEDFVTVRDPIDCGLVLVSVRDLGFRDVARFDTVASRAYDLGFGRCFDEVGPRLRGQYMDQPEGERVWVVRGGPSSHLRAFFLSRSCNGPYLGYIGRQGEGDRLLSADELLVFPRAFM